MKTCTVLLLLTSLLVSGCLSANVTGAPKPYRGFSVSLTREPLAPPPPPPPATYSVTHYRVQQDGEDCNCYTPSFTNCTVPNTCYLRAPGQQDSSRNPGVAPAVY